MIAFNILSTDPTYNLALEETLLDHVRAGEPGYFLLWQNAPSVIIGRHQNTPQEINESFVRDKGIPVVRRSTGGGAVYHDLGNLNFSFLRWADKKEDTSFQRFLTPIVSALAELGIHAKLSSRNDITVEGRKVSGSAQRKNGQKVLHHGTMLVNLDASEINTILTGNPDKYTSKGVTSHKSRVANLITFMQEKDPARAMNLVRQALLKHCADTVQDLDPRLHEEVEKLAQSKYRSWDWNYGKSPAFTNTFRCRFPWGSIECCLEIEKGCVKQCRIFGDYFSAAELSELEQKFIGLPHTKEAFSQFCKNISFEDYFMGADNDSMTQFFIDNI